MQEVWTNLLSFINQPGLRLHRERTSKKTRCRCQYINIQITCYKELQFNEISSNFFTRLPSNNFKSSRKNKKNKSWPGVNHHNIKSNSSIHPNHFCTIEPNLGPDKGGGGFSQWEMSITIPKHSPFGTKIWGTFFVPQMPFRGQFNKDFLSFPYSKFHNINKLCDDR